MHPDRPWALTAPHAPACTRPPHGHSGCPEPLGPRHQSCSSSTQRAIGMVPDGPQMCWGLLCSTMAHAAAPRAPRPRRRCPRTCQKPPNLAVVGLRATQAARVPYDDRIRPGSYYHDQDMSHDGACEGGNAGIVLYEAESGPAPARFQLRAPAAVPAHPGVARRARRRRARGSRAWLYFATARGLK